VIYPLSLLRELESDSPAEAWEALFQHAWETCSAGLAKGNAASEVTKRDRSIGDLDLFLATAGWDLWHSYEGSVALTADVLADWWASRPPGSAVLILDALSLRESPWILQAAKERNYSVHQARATGAELPADTTPFAKALGFGQRASLENNGASGKHKLGGAVTDTLDLPWKECADQVTASPDWVLWHHWPDERLHDLGGPGKGGAALTQEAAEQLTSADFWALVERLTTGRRLVVTADHGYAASGLFTDTTDAKQAQHLKERFKSGRAAPAKDETTRWVPPIDLTLETRQGRNSFVLGRRKWKSQGGYPTLTHGGLSLLEVAVPFIELSRPGGA